MTLADRMAVFMDGRIQQIGPPHDIFARPNSVDVAAFIGSPPMNLLPARYGQGGILVDGQRLPTEFAEAGERDVVAGIRPSALRLEAGGIPAKVELVEDLGDAAVIDLDVNGIGMRARLGSGPVPQEGDTVAVTARPRDIHLFDAATRQRLG